MYLYVVSATDRKYCKFDNIGLLVRAALPSCSPSAANMYWPHTLRTASRTFVWHWGALGWRWAFQRRPMRHAHFAVHSLSSTIPQRIVYCYHQGWCRSTQHMHAGRGAQRWMMAAKCFPTMLVQQQWLRIPQESSIWHECIYVASKHELGGKRALLIRFNKCVVRLRFWHTCMHTSIATQLARIPTFQTLHLSQTSSYTSQA